MASLDGPPQTTGGASVTPAMIPSQVSLSRQSSNVSGGQRRGQRRRGGKNAKKTSSENGAASNDRRRQPAQKEASEKKQSDGNGRRQPAQKEKQSDGNGRRQPAQKETPEKKQSDDGSAKGARSKQKQKRNRNRNRRKDKTTGQDQESSKTNAPSTDQKPADGGKPRARRKGKGGKYAWRRHIPPGTMDPISLDLLHSLHYPPFALVATEPYVPIPAWPVPESKEAASLQDSSVSLNKEDEHRQRLEEQWGKDRMPSTVSEDQDKALVSEPPESTPQNRHYHLYDGRALAYYLVSQQLFIDPLNRRDLSRDELVNLDAYLSRHGFRDLKVVEAYDAKGITMSTAGRAGQTAAGRAQIMQQEAQTLLNALFGNGPPPQATNRQGLQEQYAAHQHETSGGRARSNRGYPAETGDVGIYAAEGDGGGMIVIDDDANPGLRGAGFRSAASANAESAMNVQAPAFNPNSLWSASHITGQYSHAASVHRHNFPSLPTPGNAAASAPADSSNGTNEAAEKAPSRSLLKITNVVKKTDPAELQRQREARAEAQHRAMLANMSFVPPGSAVTPATMTTPGALHPQQGNLQPPTGPSDGQLERNRALASALGVAPATARQNFNSGWARPTTANIELDQFGNELNAAQYPDALVLEARERMGELLKLEKRWKSFLADDKSASLPLKPMDRPLRKFVHEYSDFWRLHTESFDPQPKRYIHCVKLRDTSIPHPLLSEAARNWRGPGQLPPQQLRPNEAEHTSRQTAGQSTVSREFPPAPPREPLKLLPRSEDGAGDSSAVRADTQTDTQLNSRFDALLGRERKKLDLAPRTIPAELPPFQPKGGAGTADDRLREKEREKARKKQEEEERKRRLLEGAFASSDEEASLSSGWEEEEQLYESGSDSEE